ncbi:MAG: hypothetical protein IKO35_01095 [Elusimicrobiaceae bacterium]|nr:hypothetical protein [Elusimicrobiaceae bacterium]
MPQLDLHCEIDEDAFSLTIFLTRLLAGFVLAYMAVGGLLYYREFLYNVAALGWPMPVAVGISLLLIQLILALMVMLGWFTRWVGGLSVLCSAAVGIIFFAADINKIYVALLVLLMGTLLPCMLMGPGRISLDYKHALRHAQKTFRG